MLPWLVIGLTDSTAQAAVADVIVTVQADDYVVQPLGDDVVIRVPADDRSVQP